MSVEDSDTLDSMGIDRASGEVVLTISDHLPWTEAHLTVLEKKLASYVRFCENGQLLEANPGVANRKVVIRLYAKYRPTDVALKFLQQAAVRTSERGLAFRFGPLPPLGYECDAG